MSSVQMRLVRELPVVTCWASHNGKTVQLEALVDTGSAGTMLKTDVADALGISHTNATGVYTVVGVGGREPVYTHWLDRFIISDHAATDVLAEISGMEYGLPIDAIIGADVLQSIGAIIRMGPLLIEFEE